ncbi:MAG: primase, partial [Solirubrobacteraceae bacterium]|nr:primase [Solirubrobacteraceae bacterium]
IAETLMQAPPPPSRPAPPRPAPRRPTPDLGSFAGAGGDEDPGLAALLAADPGRDGDVARPPAPSNPASRALDRRAETELAYLALCVALPAAGARRLADADLERLFSGAVVRRAAEHLRTHAESPSSGLPREDDALAGLIAELVLRAGAHESPDPADLDRAGLMLELARLDRDIAAARAAQSPLSDLAAERQRVLGEIRKVAH